MSPHRDGSKWDGAPPPKEYVPRRRVRRSATPNITRLDVSPPRPILRRGRDAPHTETASPIFNMLETLLSDFELRGCPERAGPRFYNFENLPLFPNELQPLQRGRRQRSKEKTSDAKPSNREHFECWEMDLADNSQNLPRLGRLNSTNVRPQAISEVREPQSDVILDRIEEYLASLPPDGFRSPASIPGGFSPVGEAASSFRLSSHCEEGCVTTEGTGNHTRDGPTYAQHSSQHSPSPTADQEAATKTEASADRTIVQADRKDLHDIILRITKESGSELVTALFAKQIFDTANAAVEFTAHEPRAIAVMSALIACRDAERYPCRHECAVAAGLVDIGECDVVEAKLEKLAWQNADLSALRVKCRSRISSLRAVDYFWQSFGATSEVMFGAEGNAIPPFDHESWREALRKLDGALSVLLSCPQDVVDLHLARAKGQVEDVLSVQAWQHHQGLIDLDAMLGDVQNMVRD
jgi:hypothetical protein